MFIYPKPKKIEIFENQFLPIKNGDIAISQAGLVQGAKVKLSLIAPLMKPQGYELEISQEGISINTNGEQGARIAFQTLRQIIAQGENKDDVLMLPCLKISDYPDLEIRGFMLDISRCKVPTMQTLIQLVDLLSLFKFNRLELYTEHTYAFKNHELVWGDSSPMTAPQYRALDAICKRAGIELVANLNSLGHFDRWLRYDDYAHLAECKAPFIDPMGNTRVYPTTLCPDEKAVDFMASLYDDFLPNFTSQFFNVGCDEPWELGSGKSAAACEAKMQGQDIEKGKHRVYIEYLKKLENLCTVRGKKMQFWADVLLEEPELAKNLSEDTTAILWGYYPDSPIDEEAKILHDLNRKFIIAGGTNTWNSFALRLDAAYQNVKDVSSAAKKWGAQGAILTNWGDNGNHQAWSVMWLPVAAFAQSMWGEDFEEADACKAVDKFIFNDPTENMSKAITELGRADPAKKLHSLHNKLFFGKPSEIESLKKDGVEKHFDKIFKGAQKAIEYIFKAQPRCSDAEVCKGELLLAADMMKWAVARANDDVNVESLNLRKGLKLMRGQYEQLWLARARVGGLFESSARAFINRSTKSAK